MESFKSVILHMTIIEKLQYKISVQEICLESSDSDAQDIMPFRRVKLYSGRIVDKSFDQRLFWIRRI